MFRTNSPTDSERSDELQLDRWLVIGIESSYASLKHHNDLYGNRHLRQLLSDSSSHRDGECQSDGEC